MMHVIQQFSLRVWFAYTSLRNHDNPMNSLVLTVILVGALLITPVFAQTTRPAPKRIVAVGDSITEGHTYPYLIQQALAEAGKEVPVIINAGVGGDTAKGILTRLDRDIFRYEPDLVILDTGINDMGIYNAKEYEAHMRQIITQLRDKNIPILLATSSVLGAKHFGALPNQAHFNAVVRRLGAEFDYPVAEVYDRMIEAGFGAPLQEPDGAHLNYEGYRLLTRAMLDALGHRDVPVPAEWKIPLMPGVIASWKVRAVEKGVELTEESVKDLKSDDTWKIHTLPEQQKNESWWLEQQRARGVSMQLSKVLGEGKRYQALATIHSDTQRDCFVNLGAGVGKVFLNGVQINKADLGTFGYTPGARREKVTLKAGENVLIFETDGWFFVSVTDDDKW